MKLMLAAVLACSTAMASADPPPATDPAALFGAREAIGHVDISPSGERLAYMVPGPGRGSILYTIALAGGAPQVAIYSDMNPERLRWCNFVSGARLICEFDLIQKDGMTLIPFIRLAAADADGANIKLLGTRSSDYETYFKPLDPAVLDWLLDEPDVVLMSRNYVPENRGVGTLLSNNKDGLGVDRINVRSLKTASFESPKPNATVNRTNGRGRVR